MMIDGIANRPLYFYQKDIIGLSTFTIFGSIGRVQVWWMESLKFLDLLGDQSNS